MCMCEWGGGKDKYILDFAQLDWHTYFNALRIHIYVSFIILTSGTFAVPNIPLSTNMHREIITSSDMSSMTLAASPATKANSTGARYRFQNKNISPRLAVVLPMCPNKLPLGSQKMRSKHSTTLLRLPKPKRSMAATFQSGNGGENWTVFGSDWVFLLVDCFNTPKGNVQSTTSPVNNIKHTRNHIIINMLLYMLRLRIF